VNRGNGGTNKIREEGGKTVEISDSEIFLNLDILREMTRLSATTCGNPKIQESPNCEISYPGFGSRVIKNSSHTQLFVFYYISVFCCLYKQSLHLFGFSRIFGSLLNSNFLSSNITLSLVQISKHTGGGLRVLPDEKN
jgi:hypothetical protein